MSPLTIGVIMLVTLVVIILVRFPIAFAFLLCGFWGFAAIRGFDAAFGLLSTRVFWGTASYPLTVMPLFILMGELFVVSGVGQGLFRASRLWLGNVRGGLPMATIMANGLFGAACGMPTAATAVFIDVALPEMLDAKTDRSLAAGSIVSAAGLSAVMPPSVIVIIAAYIAQVPIHLALIAGIIPALLTIGVYIVMITIRIKINPALSPTTGGVSWGEKFRSLKGLWAMIAVVVLVIGGMYTGIFVPTEAASFGAFGALIIALAMRKLTWPKFRDSLVNTIRLTTLIFIIVGGISIFTAFLTASGVLEAASRFVVGLPYPTTVIVIITMGLLLFMGSVLDVFSAIYLFMPIATPVMRALGVDMMWYVLLVVKMASTGMFTPPVGLNSYMFKIMRPDFTYGEIFRGAGWFVVAEMVIMALLIAFPVLILWLPLRW